MLDKMIVPVRLLLSYEVSTQADCDVDNRQAGRSHHTSVEQSPHVIPVARDKGIKNSQREKSDHKSQYAEKADCKGMLEHRADHTDTFERIIFEKWC